MKISQGRVDIELSHAFRTTHGFFTYAARKKKGKVESIKSYNAAATLMFVNSLLLVSLDFSTREQITKILQQNEISKSEIVEIFIAAVE